LTLVNEIINKPVDKMTAPEMWVFFLAKADDEKYDATIEQILKLRKGIEVADEMLRTISQDEIERARYHTRKMALQDAEHARVASFKEGVKEGIVEGVKKGIVEGVKKGRQEGIVEGVKKGRQEGIVEGRQEILKELAATLQELGAPAELIEKTTDALHKR
jgi:flagellar biosynthesis/type III secretory pathway protein FliH